LRISRFFIRDGSPYSPEYTAVFSVVNANITPAYFHAAKDKRTPQQPLPLQSDAEYGILNCTKTKGVLGWI
jgi:hypothetical protein